MPLKGYKQTEEHRRKVSEAKKGKKSYEMTEEIRRKISEAKKGKKHPMWGKHHTKETRKKMSESQKKAFQEGRNVPPFKGKYVSKEIRKKMSEAHKGKKLSKEAKRKLSEFHKGKKLSKETRKKLSEANKGEKSPVWQGGKSFEPYSIDWTETLRKAIRERDHYTCQLCGQYGLAVHHIDYDKKNCNPENLITLCNSCHIKTNFNRDYWKNYFQKIYASH